MPKSVPLKLYDLSCENGNYSCADCTCKAPQPKWASSSLGVFLCLNCVGIHRGLGVNLSVTKSIELDKWTEEMYQNMASMGNIKANAKWAQHVPVCWRKPTPLDHNLDFYVEEWIRAKYERKEFLDASEDTKPYCSGEKDGVLSKRERNASRWNQRYFRLDALSSSLSYYNKQTDPSPIRRIELKQINVMLCSDKKTAKFFSMQISFAEEKEKSKPRTRRVYVHAETGKDIVDWYLAIRSARLKVLGIKESDKNASQMLSVDYIKEGWLRKSGPGENQKYKQRWITLERNKFSYHEDPMDSIAKNEVGLKNLPELYSVSEGVDGKHPEEAHPFMVQTPERVFNFSAETSEEMEEWMQAFRDAIQSSTLDVGEQKRMSVTSAMSSASGSSGGSCADSTL